MHQHALPPVKGEGLFGVGVNEEVTLAVAQVQAQGAGQIGGKLCEQAVQVDVDHDHPEDLLLRVVHRGGHLQGGPIVVGLISEFVVDAGA